jgi:CheY-like chemotaxis protein
MFFRAETAKFPLVLNTPVKFMSFLIVDDSAVMRRTIGFLLRDVAADIFECGDGAEALSAYAAHHPDWVLMDIEMPRMDGLAATREICAAYPDARVVIVTRNGESDIREAAVEAGASGFVVKENLLELRSLVTGISR